MSFVEKEDYDFNNNELIDVGFEQRILLEDRRRMMEDADKKRDAQRQMTWCALSGMVLYPVLIVLTSSLGFSQAATLLSDTANIYVVAASGVAAAYFGFNALENKR